MATELVPWARGQYNVVRDPRKTVVGGASAGGFGATYLGLAHSEVFGNVLAMSAAVWWSPAHNGGLCAGICPDSAGRPVIVNKDAITEPNWLAQLALKQPPPKARFYLSAGTFEVDDVGAGAAILEENRHLRDILRAKGVEVIFNQFVGGHDTMGWRGAMADGLQKLLPAGGKPQARPAGLGVRAGLPAFQSCRSARNALFSPLFSALILQALRQHFGGNLLWLGSPFGEEIVIRNSRMPIPQNLPFRLP